MDGDLIGVVFAEALARVPPTSRTTTRLGQICTPLPPAYICRPDAMASSLLDRPPLRGQVLAVVVDDGQVTGLVTTAELRLAMLRASCQPARRPGPAGEPARPAGGSPARTSSNGQPAAEASEAAVSAGASGRGT
jgi:hypothetical protein